MARRPQRPDLRSRPRGRALTHTTDENLRAQRAKLFSALRNRSSYWKMQPPRCNGSLPACRTVESASIGVAVVCEAGAGTASQANQNSYAPFEIRLISHPKQPSTVENKIVPQRVLQDAIADRFGPTSIWRRHAGNRAGPAAEQITRPEPKPDTAADPISSW